MGALLRKLVDDLSVIEDEARLREVVRYASACGAITTTKKGAIPALPSHSQVLTLLNHNKNLLFPFSNCFPFLNKDN